MLRATALLLALALLFSMAVCDDDDDDDVAPSPAPSSPDHHGMTCREMLHELHPCMAYLKGKKRMPSEDCCDGVEKVAREVKMSRKEMIYAWVCIRKALFRIRVYPKLVRELPWLCGIHNHESMQFPPLAIANFDQSEMSEANIKP